MENRPNSKQKKQLPFCKAAFRLVIFIYIHIYIYIPPVLASRFHCHVILVTGPEDLLLLFGWQGRMKPESLSPAGECGIKPCRKIEVALMMLLELIRPFFGGMMIQMVVNIRPYLGKPIYLVNKPY